jgi:hypothetical protein
MIPSTFTVPSAVNLTRRTTVETARAARVGGTVVLKAACDIVAASGALILNDSELEGSHETLPTRGTPTSSSSD